MNINTFSLYNNKTVYESRKTKSINLKLQILAILLEYFIENIAYENLIRVKTGFYLFKNQ